MIKRHPFRPFFILLSVMVFALSSYFFGIDMPWVVAEIVEEIFVVSLWVLPVLLIIGVIYSLGNKRSGDVPAQKNMGNSEVLAKLIKLLEIKGIITAEELSGIGVSQSPMIPLEKRVAPVVPETESARENRSVALFTSWIKENWIMKLGGLIFLIGIGWLVNYAFAEDWIGPRDRITLGFLVGVAFLLLGQWRIRLYKHQGSTLLVIGSVVFLLTTLAGRFIYDFFTPALALSMMFLSVVFPAAASVRHRVYPLAIASLIMAGIAPFLVDFVMRDVFETFSYLFVVAAGTLWIVALTGWRNLAPAALVLVFLYDLPYLTSYFTSHASGSEKSTALFFAFLFAALFYAVNLAGIIKRRSVDHADILTAAGNGFVLLAWISIAVSEHLRSIVVVVPLLVSAVGAYAVYSVTRIRAAFLTYAGIAFAMLVAATAFELSNPMALIIAFTVEVSVASWLVAVIVQSRQIGERVAALLAIPAISVGTQILSWFVGATRFTVPFFSNESAALATLTAAFFFVGYFLRDTSERFAANGALLRIRGISPVFIFAGALYANMFIQIILWQLFAGASENFAVMGALVVYALEGVACYVVGHRRQAKGITQFGVFVLLYAVVRIIIGAWDFPLFWRIMTYLSIGAVLIAGAFIRKSKKQTITS